MQAIPRRGLSCSWGARARSREVITETAALDERFRRGLWVEATARRAGRHVRVAQSDSEKVVTPFRVALRADRTGTFQGTAHYQIGTRPHLDPMAPLRSRWLLFISRT
jgi:hypothetical protein